METFASENFNTTPFSAHPPQTGPYPVPAKTKRKVCRKARKVHPKQYHFRSGKVRQYFSVGRIHIRPGAFRAGYTPALRCASVSFLRGRARAFRKQKPRMKNNRKYDASTWAHIFRMIYELHTCANTELYKCAGALLAGKNHPRPRGEKIFQPPLDGRWMVRTDKQTLPYVFLPDIPIRRVAVNKW